MCFAWVKAKASANLLRHGINFADAATTFSDQQALTIVDPSTDHEERYVTMAMDATGRVLVTVYTWRGDAVRLISARKATAGERRRYIQARRSDL